MKKIIDYNFVFNRTPPYSHRNYNDEFMQISANDIIKNLGIISKDEVDYYENL